MLNLKSGLIVSCQATSGTPLDTPEFITAQSLTVLQAGAIGIRAQSLRNISAIAKVTNCPLIGLVKRVEKESPIYITPSVVDVVELELAGASIVAIDGTNRLRPGGMNFSEFIRQVKLSTNIKLLADVDTLEAALIAESLGCDAVATTLSGYTENLAMSFPNLELIEKIVKKVKIPVIAEGGFSTPELVARAFDNGAWSVCVGTAITNSYLLTKEFLSVIK